MGFKEIVSIRIADNNFSMKLVLEQTDYAVILLLKESSTGLDEEEVFREKGFSSLF